MFVVTGGGSGIGQALAWALAEREKEVIIIGRRQEALLKTAAFSSLITFICADLSTKEGRQTIVDQLKPAQQLEGLVHNAGTLEPILPITEISEGAWEQVIATNLTAPFFLSRALLPKLIHGRIMHIGSGAAYFPVKSWAPYCVSKAALAMLTRCWQLECPEYAIASVMPGIIDTAMQELIRTSQGMDEEKRGFFKKLHQENRLITTSTVAQFLTWLLLDVNRSDFSAQEWDIYDRAHHRSWLKSPHCVPHWE